MVKKAGYPFLNDLFNQQALPLFDHPVTARFVRIAWVCLLLTHKL